MKKALKTEGLLVRTRGLEPPQAFAHKILNLARLPIPPRPRSAPEDTTKDSVASIALNWILSTVLEERADSTGKIRDIRISTAPSRERSVENRPQNQPLTKL